MKSGSKISIGAAATVILALVGHAATGDKFVSGLEQKAQTELAARGLDAARVSFSRAPLSRRAILDGDLTDISKEEALNVVRAIPGVSNARWKGDDILEKDGGDGITESGLPPATRAKIAKCQDDVDEIIASAKISFRSGSAYVSPESNQVLDKVAMALKPCGGLSISVEGHTDDNGDSAINRTMSQERADRIKAGLVERGISSALITATGYGSSRPRAKGTDAAADAENRRIEFRIGSADRLPKNDAEAQQGN
ncbi:OmpA family protein [Parasphingorhabdus sp.]|uniref:OmpA family protein n=1 Tax=Parasphingorhabdus sp. TaxID=2709688 RepID=UPI003A8E07A1